MTFNAAIGVAAFRLALLNRRGGPVNTVAPSHDYVAPLIPVIGTQINGVAGTWAGSPVITHQWQKALTDAGPWTDVTGATSIDYTPQDADDVFGYVLQRIEIPNGNTGAAAASAATGVVTAIYGVSWDKESSPTLTRTDFSVGKTAAAGLDGSTPTNDFDAQHIFGEITEVTDGAGNVFVRIPKFYIEKTDGVGSKTWRICKQPFGSAYLPWCFWDFTNNVALDYIDVGKYDAGYDGVSKLTSKSGEYPLVSQNIVTFRTRAEANGAGYHQLDIHTLDVLQTLFYVEFATLHSQSIMAGLTAGAYSASHTATATEASANRIVLSTANAALFEIGQTIGIGTSLDGNQIASNRTVTGKTVVDGSNTALDFDGAPVNVTTGNICYSLGWKNGWSSAVAASSGSIGSNSTGRFPCMYRGIESPWGTVWQFLDGVNVNERQAWVCKDADDYTSNLFTAPYEQLSYVNHNADGYTTAMGYDADRPYAALSTAVGGAGATYYADYYYQATGQRIARVGGGWGSSANAGLSVWNLSAASSVALVSAGGRLVRKGG